MGRKKVLSIGQCNFDNSRISYFIDEKYQAVFETADSHQEAIELASRDSFDLILVNRILDSTGTLGVDLVRDLRSSDSAVTVMLVSNFEDAQNEAVAAGAVQGFGKATLTDPATFDLLDKYLKPDNLESI